MFKGQFKRQFKGQLLQQTALAMTFSAKLKLAFNLNSAKSMIFHNSMFSSVLMH